MIQNLFYLCVLCLLVGLGVVLMATPVANEFIFETYVDTTAFIMDDY